MNKYKPSTGERSSYYQETSAVNDLAEFNTSAAMGNLADVLKAGPVKFPNILAPDSFRRIRLETRKLPNSDANDKH